MAHNLNFKDGQASFFTVREKSWHNLGKVLEKCPTSEEAIKHAGLNYEVEKLPLYCEGHNFSRNEREIKGYFATARKDTGDIFGVVGSRYQVVQNKDAFGFFDAIVGEGEAIYETAGALGKGEIVFITAKLPSYIKVGKDDIEKYLLLTMSHDGSSSICATFTPVRVVCNNTLQAALRSATNKVTVRHTASAHENLKQAHKILGITNMLSDELGTIFNTMAKTKISDSIYKLVMSQENDKVLPKGESYENVNIDGFLNILYSGTKDEDNKDSTRILNIRNDIKRFYFEGIGQNTETCKGTVFGLYNAVTGYYQNVKDYKNDDKKMSSIFMGNDANVSQQAFNLALSLI